MTTTAKVDGKKPHVVIIGGGFGGLAAARALRRAPVRVTLVDRNNYHLFQPLLYQVATAVLSPANIATPIRSILYSQKNAAVLLEEAERIDLDARKVYLRRREGESHQVELDYDYLIVAAGAETSYFGHDDWQTTAAGLKDLDDALEMRRRILLALEAAERATDEAERRRLLTFVVIGGGPTGVELAGAISNLTRAVAARDFRRVRPESIYVVLLEGGPHLLAAFPQDLAASARRQLEDLQVEVRLGARVVAVDGAGVRYHETNDGAGERLISSSTVLWAAGVHASPLGAKMGLPVDKGGRVTVAPDLSIAGHPEAFVIGDLALYTHQDGKPLPGVAPVAMQEGRYVARVIAESVLGRPSPPFRYIDKGNLATIGRSKAIAEFGKLHVSGFLAWALWLGIHIMFLIGFRNRVIVMLEWFWSYVTFQRGARLITGHRIDAGPPLRGEAGLPREEPGRARGEVRSEADDAGVKKLVESRT